MADASVLAQRYGRGPDDPRRTRRRLAVALVGFTALAAGFAGWAAVHRADSSVTWNDLGFVSPPDDSHATVAVRIEFAPGGSAVCTVRAVNAVQTEIGRADVRIGPSASGVVTLDVPLRTSERATAAGVKACVRR
jgi:hypothetical protein